MTEKSLPTFLSVENLSKNFGSFKAIQNISIEIEEGEFACFLGPSGCGKTTLLRCIAGLEKQSSGTITQNEIEISLLPPSARDFGIVFQSYALFPNLTVFSNISYGLINHKWGKDKITSRVNELLDLVDLKSHMAKYPGQLSGGEQQRVALARALATSPGLLLLDEPLSALDAKVRVYLRKQIKDLHRKLGITTIMVTHDQEEAQSMADRIFVMKDGKIIQSGSPKEIYENANSPFIADFIGITNFIDARVVKKNKVACHAFEVNCNTEDLNLDLPVRLAIRPESINLNHAVSGVENCVSAVIMENEFLGSFQRIYVESTSLSNELLMIDVASNSFTEMDLTPGTQIHIALPPDQIRVYLRD
ncbi:MAG: putative 2-aminoethylphosphonate ABC transporter ATP-binding protein [SAR324 cluster bacterium]|nr:putative 2-aminoethylphosphonate ABC transporter ATP-binding protein [SAR324 cluster bacterium]